MHFNRNTTLFTQMFSTFSTGNCVDRPWGNIEVARYITPQPPFLDSSEHISNLGVCEFSGHNPSTLVPLISLVVTRRPQEQVFRFYTRRIIAFVTDLKLSGIAFMDSVRDARSPSHLSTERKMPVPFSVPPGDPYPALTRLIYFVMEALNFIRREVWNKRELHGAIIPRNPYKQEVFA
jgi:hypothetical protein